MAVTLVGEIVNSADAVTGYNAGNISGDDDFVEGLGALGVKASATTQELYTTSLGASAPYNFSAGGSEAGYHIIMWFNTKTPIDTKANGGLAIIVGNGTSRGKWYVRPSGFYKGGFITRVANPKADFNNIAAGSWTLAGNPAQLSNITQMGGGFVTVTSIMGSFNNVQIDQITIGEGLRVTGTETFESVRVADEDTEFYGWWSSSNGSFIGKGKLYIGPATGSTATTFNDTAFRVVFANEDVDSDHYEIQTIGSGTNVSWSLASISSADPAVARWNLTVDDTTASFVDSDGVWSGFRTVDLAPGSILSNTTLIDGTTLLQDSASLNGVSVLDANTLTGESFINVNDPSLITNGTFVSPGTGHAIELTSATAGKAYSFSGNSFSGYFDSLGTNLNDASGSNDAAIYNNSGGLVTLNVSNGTGFSVRNGVASTTIVNNTVTVTVNVQEVDGTPISGARVRVTAAAGGDLTVGTTIISGTTNGSGVIQNTGFDYTNPQPITGVARSATTPPFFKSGVVTGTIQSTGLETTVILIRDQ